MMRYFSYDGDGNCELHPTKAEAVKACEDAIDAHRDHAAEDGWDDTVEWICWGEIRQMATAVNEQEICTDESCDFGCDKSHNRGFDGTCDYQLRDVDAAP